MEGLHYGNWIRTKILWLLGVATTFFAILTVLPLPAALRVVSGGLGLASLISFLYPLYCYLMFSPKGGNLQDDFYELILEKTGSNTPGRILDIGTGNGILAIKAALDNPSATVTGVDHWGKDWEYSNKVCEQNAKRANVADRVIFSKANAAALKFPDACFDVVLSNMTFHEVKMVKQKSNVLREALRVLKPGGRFVFIDNFYDQNYYGDSVAFEALLHGLKLEKVVLRPLHEELIFPKLLQHGRALGKAGIVHGKK